MLNWADASHVLQAIYWSLMVGLWAMGYHHGNKVA